MFFSGEKANAQKVADYINTRVKDRIQAKAKYDISNLPDPSIPEKDKTLFSLKKQLENITADDVKRPDGIMNAEELYKSIRKMMAYWTIVRKFKLDKYQGDYSNGGAITYSVAKSYRDFGFLSDEWRDTRESTPVKEDFVALTGNKIDAEKLKAAIDKLYDEWESLPELELRFSICHGNCHGACHGSKGW